MVEQIYYVVRTCTYENGNYNWTTININNINKYPLDKSPIQAIVDWTNKEESIEVVFCMSICSTLRNPFSSNTKAVEINNNGTKIKVCIYNDKSYNDFNDQNKYNRAKFNFNVVKTNYENSLVTTKIAKTYNSVKFWNGGNESPYNLTKLARNQKNQNDYYVYA